MMSPEPFSVLLYRFAIENVTSPHGRHVPETESDRAKHRLEANVSSIQSISSASLRCSVLSGRF